MKTGEPALNNDRLNRWIGLFANLGVVIGIIFLAVEIRQNNQFLAEESKYSQVQSRIDFNQEIADSTEFAGFYYETDDPVEIEMHRRWAVKRRVLLQWQWEYTSIWWSTNESELTIRNNWKKRYEQNRFNELWQNEREYFTPSFMQYIDQYVAN